MILRRTLAILLSLTLIVTAQSMALARGANAATGQMVICAGTTTATLYVDAQGNPTRPPHICPDCLLTALTAILPETVGLPPQPRPIRGARPILSIPHDTHRPTRAHARAPPIPV